MDTADTCGICQDIPLLKSLLLLRIKISLIDTKSPDLGEIALNQFVILVHPSSPVPEKFQYHGWTQMPLWDSPSFSSPWLLGCKRWCLLKQQSPKWDGDLTNQGVLAGGGGRAFLCLSHLWKQINNILAPYCLFLTIVWRKKTAGKHEEWKNKRVIDYPVSWRWFPTVFPLNRVVPITISLYHVS